MEQYAASGYRPQAWFADRPPLETAAQQAGRSRSRGLEASWTSMTPQHDAEKWMPVFAKDHAQTMS